MRCHRLVRGRETGCKQWRLREIAIDHKPPTRGFRQLYPPIRKRGLSIDNPLQIIEQLERRRERGGTEALGAQSFFKSLTRYWKIHCFKAFSIFFHPCRRKTKCHRR